MMPNEFKNREPVQGLISVAGKTDGLLSDHVEHMATPNGYLLLVADGLEDAINPPSRIVIRELKESLGERKLIDPEKAMVEAFQKADLAVREYSQSRLSRRGAHPNGVSNGRDSDGYVLTSGKQPAKNEDHSPKATATEAESRAASKTSAEVEFDQQSATTATATAILLDANAIHVGHVGDGRAYRIRGNLITRMTSDQTFVRVMINSGVIEPGQARVNRHRHALLRALGGGVDPDITVAFSHLDMAAGDIIVVCSDGLADVIEDMEVGRLVSTFFPPDAAAHALIDLALRRGARKSISTIVVRVG